VPDSQNTNATTALDDVHHVEWVYIIQFNFSHDFPPKVGCVLYKCTYYNQIFLWYVESVELCWFVWVICESVVYVCISVLMPQLYNYVFVLQHMLTFPCSITTRYGQRCLTFLVWPCRTHCRCQLVTHHWHPLSSVCSWRPCSAELVKH